MPMVSAKILPYASMKMFFFSVGEPDVHFYTNTVYHRHRIEVFIFSQSLIG